MVVITTGLVPPSLLYFALTMITWESNSWLGKNNVQLKELWGSKDSCTGCNRITEIMLKTALNTIQPINQPINQSITTDQIKSMWRLNCKCTLNNDICFWTELKHAGYKHFLLSQFSKPCFFRSFNPLPNNKIRD